MNQPERIKVLTTRVEGLRAALATDAELAILGQFGTASDVERAKTLNFAIQDSIAKYEQQLAELSAVQGDPLGVAWLEYKQARQAYNEASATKGGFDNRPKHPKNYVRAATSRLIAAYADMDQLICGPTKPIELTYRGPGSCGAKFHNLENFAGGARLPVAEIRVVLDNAQGGKFIRLEDVNGNVIKDSAAWERPNGNVELQFPLTVVKLS